MLLDEKIPVVCIKNVFQNRGALAMLFALCIPFIITAQEIRDTVQSTDSTGIEMQDTLAPRDTIITISDTIIRISDTVITKQERGDQVPEIITENDRDHKRWDKLATAFRKDSTKNVNIIGFPIIAYLPETNLTFGATLQIYFRQRALPKNRQSAIRLKGQYTLNKQYEAFVEYELFLLENNRIWLDGIVHYQNWLQEFYGIGNKTEYDNKEIIEFQRWHTDLRALYKMKWFYLGPQVRFSKVFDMRYAADSTFDKANLLAKDLYQTTGLGAALVFDTRDNNIFPFHGYYISLSNYSHPRWSSREQFRFANLELDYRHFFNPRKGKHVLVVRAYASATFGDPPFRLNSMHGGQYTGRGYYEGRYTDRNLILAQMEWRFPIAWRFRGVLFASAGDVFNKPSDMGFSTIKWAVGAGIRYVVNLKERNSIRLDYAHGRSKTDKGFYFGINEVY